VTSVQRSFPSTRKTDECVAQFWCNLSPFRINTHRVPASVDSKPFTQYLNALDATLTKNRGRVRVIGNPELTGLGAPKVPSRIYLSFSYLRIAHFASPLF
jgi:hypothetical protein